MDIMDTFYDGDLKDIWDSDLDPSDTLKLTSDADMSEWFLEREVKSTVILNDKLISDALIGNLPIKAEHSYSLCSNITTDTLPESPGSKIDDMEDECYPAISMKTATSNIRRNIIDSQSLLVLDDSLNPTLSTMSPKNINNRLFPNSNGCNSQMFSSLSVPLSINVRPNSMSPNSKRPKMRNSISSSSDDMDLDDDVYVKNEPLSPDSSCPSSPEQKINKNADRNNFSNKDLSLENAMLLNSKEETIHKPFISTNIKVEQQPGNQMFGLPPTPPSSLPSDESEGNQSPEHHSLISPLSSPNISHSASSSGTSAILTPASSNSVSPTSASLTPAAISSRRSTASTSSNTSQNSTSSSSSSRGYTSASTRQPIHTPLISSQPKGSTGTLVLTEEEKRTLLAEGYPIPTRLPLTKAEEKSLKKIRRKIKNKISAQESRRKKKEYMDQLERRVEVLVTENIDYKSKIESLEDSNANLLSQLQTTSYDNQTEKELI